jgi:NADP-dependent 3-hydroxy acid dehydrogenase YdfG
MSDHQMVVAISGGAGRIGASLVINLIKKNYKVLVGDISSRNINFLKKKINQPEVIFFCGDLSKKNIIDNFIKQGVRNFKKIDAVINCSYPKFSNNSKKFEYLTQDNLNKNITNHLGGAIIFAQRFLKYFLKNKKGNLINFSSIQGVCSPKFNHYKNLYDEKLKYYFDNNYFIKDDQMVIMDIIFTNQNLFYIHKELNSQFNNWFMFQRLLL